MTIYDSRSGVNSRFASLISIRAIGSKISSFSVSEFLRADGGGSHCHRSEDGIGRRRLREPWTPSTLCGCLPALGAVIFFPATSRHSWGLTWIDGDECGFMGINRDQ